MNSTLEDKIEKFSASYNKIDFRAAQYKIEEKWHYIIAIFRFTNDSNKDLSVNFKKLELDKYKSEKFKINYDILEVHGWKEKWKNICNKIDNFNENEKKPDLSSYINIKGRYSNAFINNVDMEWNSIIFFYLFPLYLLI